MGYQTSILEIKSKKNCTYVSRTPSSGPGGLARPLINLRTPGLVKDCLSLGFDGRLEDLKLLVDLKLLADETRRWSPPSGPAVACSRASGGCP